MTNKFLTAAVTALTLLAAPAFAQDTAKTATPEYVYSEAPEDHVIGSDTAAQSLIVYASVTCPHCGDWFSKEWPKVKTELVETDILRVIFRPLPTQPQQLSVTGFLMAECAPSEDYFEIIEYQMNNQEKIYEAARAGGAKAEYDKIAKMAGMMDNDAIEACLSNPDMIGNIQAASNRMSASGAKGVPAFFINGASYDGEQDADAMVKLIKDMDAKGITALPKSIKPAASATTSHEGHGH